MVDLFGVSHRFAQGPGVEDGTADKATGDPVQIMGVTAPQVIEDGDLGLVGEMSDQVGADEAGAAGDEDALAQACSTISRMAGSCSSIEATSLNWVRQRSRLCVGRLILK